jgi:hypothetical protein
VSSALAFALLALGAPAASAAPAYQVGTDPVATAGGWLTTQFVDSTHLPVPAGDHFDSKFGSSFFPNYGENADVIFGLAAAKTGASKITTALAYLQTNADAYADLGGAFGGPYDGSVAKLAVAAQVAGADPTDFAGANLIQILKDDECTAASTGADTSCPAAGSAKNIFSSVSEYLAIIAEARAGGAAAPSAAALTYLLSLQCTSGGFTGETAACGSGAADPDATAYAIMALQAAGGHATALTNAVTWLTGQRNAGGYWVAQGVANVNTTGLAAAALSAQGVDVTTTRAWLLSQQVAAGQAGAGAIKYAGTFAPTTLDATSPSVIATAQALTGLVDGSSLATLTDAGATDTITLPATQGSLSMSTVKAGQSATVTGHGFIAGETVSATFNSTPVALGSTKANASGIATLAFTVPSGLAAGTHTVSLLGQTSGLTASSPITLTATATTTPTPTPTATPSPTTTPTTSANGDGELAATGQDGRRLVSLGIGGAAAVLLGGGLVFLARRRTG